MKIKLLLQPIDVPSHGLEKLQQALRMRQALEQTEPAPAISFKNWQWQAATVLLVGGLWFGLNEFAHRELTGKAETLGVTLVALHALAAPTEVLDQSSLAALPSSDPKVKMYWVMSGG